MMKNHTISTATCLALTMGLLAAPGTSLHAATVVTSSPFVLYYGYDNNGSNAAEWLEINASDSTPTTQGDFTVSNIITSTRVSDYGFVFTNGTPTYQEEQFSFSASSTTFNLDIAASYTGATEGTNYQTRFIITSIRIWGVVFNNQPTSDLAFQETTPGHESASNPITLISVPANASNLRPLNNYTQLDWNPDDFFTAGVSQDRSFTLTANRVIDGLTIEGYIETSYEAIPEPSTAALGFIGGGALLATFLRRMRKK